jgi:hypothetical protein
MYNVKFSRADSLQCIQGNLVIYRWLGTDKAMLNLANSKSGSSQQFCTVLSSSGFRSRFTPRWGREVVSRMWLWRIVEPKFWDANFPTATQRLLPAWISSPPHDDTATTSIGTTSTTRIVAPSNPYFPNQALFSVFITIPTTPTFECSPSSFFPFLLPPILQTQHTCRHLKTIFIEINCLRIFLNL